MAKHAAHATACFAIFVAALLSGCVARGPVLAPAASELAATPFFPQKKFQCGPAALATVLAASGVDVTPDGLSPALYLPARRGSLQVEMQATPRSYDRLALALPRSLESLVAEVEAGRPVLVLHNYGLTFWPRWHYAVVVGYDPRADVFILRSGVERRQRMRTRRFMIAWHYAGRWAMVVLRPGELPALDDSRSYLEAAATFETTAKPADARAAFDAAVHRWPGEPVAYIGRGTAAYRLGELPAAARDFSQALEFDAGQWAARNNLAQTLVDLRCPNQALRLLEAVDEIALAPAMRTAIDDTRRQARQMGSQDDPSCAAIP